MIENLINKKIFAKNRLACFLPYIKNDLEVVPHFFSKSSYFLRRNGEIIFALKNSCLVDGAKLVSTRKTLNCGEKITCAIDGLKYDLTGMLIGDRSKFLKNEKLINFNNFFFFEKSIDEKKQIENVFAIPNIFNYNFNNLSFDNEQVTFYHCNWKNLLELDLKIQHSSDLLPTNLSKDPLHINLNNSQYQLLQVPNKDLKVGTLWDLYLDELKIINWSKDWVRINVIIYPGLTITLFPHAIILKQLVPLSEKMTVCYNQTFLKDDYKDNLNLHNAFIDGYSSELQKIGSLSDLLEDGRGDTWKPSMSIIKDDSITHFYAWLDNNY